MSGYFEIRSRFQGNPDRGPSGGIAEAIIDDRGSSLGCGMPTLDRETPDDRRDDERARVAREERRYPGN